SVRRLHSKRTTHITLSTTLCRPRRDAHIAVDIVVAPATNTSGGSARDRTPPRVAPAIWGKGGERRTCNPQSSSTFKVGIHRSDRDRKSTSLNSSQEWISS